MLIRKHDGEEDYGNSDRYLITYADLITLLLGLFVILYASSQVDIDKFTEFSKALGEYFRPKEQVLEGGDGVLKARKGIPEPILPTASEVSISDVERLANELLKPFISNQSVTIRRTKSVVILQLSEKLLFESGRAELQSGSTAALDSLARLLAGLPMQIAVDGHTDSSPISSFRYVTNWHLSAARALSVAYFLMRHGVSEENVVVRGFGSQRPIADNTTSEGRTENRRVEIHISALPVDALSSEGYYDEAEEKLQEQNQSAKQAEQK